MHRDDFKSGLEFKNAQRLEKIGSSVNYETDVVLYTKPAKPSKYYPDFRLPNGIYIETKGQFVTADRQKHLLIKQQHPHLDIRFVFSNSKQHISKTSKTTYAAWAEAKGFKYADQWIPQAWIDEPGPDVKPDNLRK